MTAKIRENQHKMTNYTIKVLNFHRKRGAPEKEKSFCCDLSMITPSVTNSGLFLISAVQAIPNSEQLSVFPKSHRNLT